MAEPLSLDTSNYLTGWKLHVVIACLFFGSFVIALDTNIINVAIPHISTEFKALQDIAWYGSAYLLTVTAFQPVYGSMYKFFNTNVVYRLSIFIFEIGSILCAAAPNSRVFIVGRAVAGLGAAGVLQGALSIISQVVPLGKRPLYLAIVPSVFVIAVTVGPVLGGVFTERVTWRWCFWINLPLGAVVLVGLTIFLKLRGTPNKDRSLPLSTKLNNMDPIGCFTFIGAIVSLLLALQWGGQSKPWSSSDVIGTLVGAIAIGTLFVYLQWRRKDTALIPLRILGKRSIWTGSMVLLFLGAQTYTNVFFLPFWFQGVQGFSPVKTGVDFIPLLLSQIVFLIITGGIVKQFGHYVPYMILGEAIAIGGQVILTQLEPDTSTLFWAAGLVVSGIGSGIAMQLPYTAIAIVLDDQDIPVGNALAVLFYQLGGAVAISIGQTITITSLLALLPQRLPDLSAETVITVGAANLATLVSTPQDLATLRDIWNIAISHTMFLGVAVVGAAVPFTVGMEWLNANKVAAQRTSAAKEMEEKQSGHGSVAIEDRAGLEHMLARNS
ncbi:MFS general substrate transporter [Nemania abortiva]|nr:MFS general substrate transporter [Nemania abortiva]